VTLLTRVKQTAAAKTTWFLDYVQRSLSMKANVQFCCVHRSINSQCFSMSRTIPKIAHSCGVSTHLIHGSLGPRKSAPKRISIGSAVFAGFTNVTNRQTNTVHRPRYSVCSTVAIDRIYSYCCDVAYKTFTARNRWMASSTLKASQNQALLNMYSRCPRLSFVLWSVWRPC